MSGHDDGIAFNIEQARCRNVKGAIGRQMSERR